MTYLRLLDLIALIGAAPVELAFYDEKPRRASRIAGGWGGIRTHGRLHVAGFQDRCLKPLGHPSRVAFDIVWSGGLCKARDEPSWPDGGSDL